MRTIKLSFIVITLSVFFQACTGIKNIDSSIKPMPNTFAGTKDSANIANISWKTYFSDSVLTALIDTALRSNLDLSIALQRIQMARENVRFAKGQLFPTISVGGSAGVQQFGKYTLDGAGNTGLVIHNNEVAKQPFADYSLGLQTSWEVDLWGKIRNKKKAAVARYLADIEGKNWLVTQLVADVADNYYELLALDTELEIIQSSIKLQDSALSIVTIQKEAGVANELAVQQFSAQLLNSQKMEIDVLQRIAECENTINILLGRFPQTIVRNKSLLVKNIPNALQMGVPSDLLQNRPDIKQAELELKAANANVLAARASCFPSLNINGTLGYQAFKPSLLLLPQSLAFNALGGLTAPLINRSAIKAEFRVSKAAQIEALCNYQKTILNGFREVYNQMLSVKSSEKIVNLKSKEVAILSLAINSSIELFKTGRATYLEVLSAQQNNLQSNIELVNALKQQHNAEIGIYKALGGGWR